MLAACGRLDDGETENNGKRRPMQLTLRTSLAQGSPAPEAQLRWRTDQCNSGMGRALRRRGTIMEKRLGKSGNAGEDTGHRCHMGRRTQDQP
jgi:hypothetical protein